jgi:hypothetical protein
MWSAGTASQIGGDKLKALGQINQFIFTRPTDELF